jgi:hypothetical protein
MNYNQQVQGKPHSLQEQGYNCNDCLRPFPTSEVKRYCLDNNQGIKMYCLLCSACSYTQFSSKERIGVFPLLALEGSKITTTILNDIKTPEFKKNFEEEMRIQQEAIRNYQQQFKKSLFNCDKCFKPIALGEEKEHCFTKYKENTSMVSDMKWCLFCPSCASGFTRDLGKPINDEREVKIEKTPTFERCQEHKEIFKEIKGETWQKYLKRELERQEQEKKWQERLKIVGY